MHYNVKMRHVRVTNVVVFRTISITYPEHVFVALGSQHAMRMRRIMLLSGACVALPYFSTLSQKRYNFRENIIQHKTSVLIFFYNFRLHARVVELTRVCGELMSKGRLSVESGYLGWKILVAWRA